MINAETEGDLEMIESATNVKDIHDIIFTIREMSADEKTRYEAEMREKAIMDERSALTNSERRGFKKGIEEGRSIGIEEGSLKKAVEIVDNLVSNVTA